MKNIQIEELANNINKDNPIPYYIQLKEVLMRFIEINQLKSEDQLPGEHDLCRIFDLSRTVIRQSLSVLEQEGVIVRRKGKGAFIASRKITESLVQKLTGFHQDMAMRGTTTVSKVLIQKIIPANDLISEKLKITPGTQVLIIERVRFVNDEPIVLVTTFLPYNMCKGIEKEDLAHQSLYELLETKHNIVIERGERTIEAVLPTKEQCYLLNITKKIPLIKLESTSYLSSGAPVEYYYAYHRADKSRFKVELVRIEERGKLKTPLSKNLNDIPESNQL
jgi:GntR family transcriptional regulator